MGPLGTGSSHSLYMSCNDTLKPLCPRIANTKCYLCLKYGCNVKKSLKIQISIILLSFKNILVNILLSFFVRSPVEIDIKCWVCSLTCLAQCDPLTVYLLSVWVYQKRLWDHQMSLSVPLFNWWIFKFTCWIIEITSSVYDFTC